jgi:hypothetical protein
MTALTNASVVAGHDQVVLGSNSDLMGVPPVASAGM